MQHVELFPRLKERRRPAERCPAANRMLAVGRALMAAKLLLMDEPSMGLAPILVEEIFDIIQRSTARVTVLPVEQNAHMALSIANRGYVLRRARSSWRAPRRVAANRGSASLSGRRLDFAGRDNFVGI